MAAPCHLPLWGSCRRRRRMRFPPQRMLLPKHKKKFPSFLWVAQRILPAKEMRVFMFDQVFASPLRFFFVAAVLAAILCLYPAKVDAPQETEKIAAEATVPPAQEKSVGADLSERTGAACYLHTTLYYAPCAHSVQRREKLPAQLSGMSRELLEKEIGSVIPGAQVTGFSADEVDISRSTDIPCPLHWVLRTGEDGMLHVLQNRDGESLDVVRVTDVPAQRAGETQELLEGKIFDDVQALEGYLESISS